MEWVGLLYIYMIFQRFLKHVSKIVFFIFGRIEWFLAGGWNFISSLREAKDRMKVRHIWLGRFMIYSLPQIFFVTLQKFKICYSTIYLAVAIDIIGWNYCFTFTFSCQLLSFCWKRLSVYCIFCVIIR